MIRVFAPGKLVLMGEYAVLDGAPAIVAAVDRGVRCEASHADILRIETPTNDDRFVRAAIEACAPRALGHFRFYDQHPTGDARKAGFGRSAAATVAAVLACKVLEGNTPTRETLRELSHGIHHAVQGNGSGIDVAASVYGGVSRIEKNSVRSLNVSTPVVVFSGQSAQTGPRVAAYLNHTKRGPFLDRTAELVALFEEAPMRALDEAGALIGSMCAVAGIDYWTPELETLVSLAKRFGGGAKPSGAGGGDSVVALFPNADDTQHFVTACRNKGFSVIPALIAPGAHATEPDHV